MKRILILHNPTSGRRRAGLLRSTIRCLERRGVEVELFSTRRAGDAERRVAGLGEGGAGYDAVVAAGGDGTIREVANGLVGKELPLGVIPLGTTNVLARELRLPRSPEALAAVLVEGCTRRVHPGLQNGRRFLQMVGVGLDAWVVAAVDLERKRRFGKLAYLAELARQTRRYGTVTFDVRIDGETHRAYSLIVAKGQRYAGRFVLSRRADPGAPGLQAVLLTAPARRALLGYLVALGLGRLESWPGVRSLPARVIEIVGPQGEPVQADGDLAGRLPIKLESESRALSLLVAD